MRPRWAIVALLCSLASPASASDPLGADGAPLDTSSYTLDLYEGPVLSSTRVIALGGAYPALAEGVEGFKINPAAVAVRLPWNVRWFAGELHLSLAFPTNLGDFDFDNNGDDSYTNSGAYFVSLGGGFRFGDFGIGLRTDIQQYHVESRSRPDRKLYIGLTEWIGALAYSFLDGQLITGLGAGVHSLTFEQPAGGYLQRSMVRVTGTSLQMGVLYAPATLPIRAGASFRFAPPPSAAVDDDPLCEPPNCVQQGGDYLVDGYYVPRTFTLPPELQFGLALQILRPLNVLWVNPSDEYALADRVKDDIAIERRARASVADARAELARQRGEDPEPIYRQLDRDQARAERDEDRRIEQARELDRQRRLEPYRRMPREKLLLSIGARITGPTIDGVGLDSFLEQRVERSGESVTVQPSVGIEGEPIHDYLVVMAGTYLEPSRFEHGDPRLHGTGGAFVHIPLEWDAFGLFDADTSFMVGGAIDAAPRYFGWTITGGIWR